MARAEAKPEPKPTNARAVVASAEVIKGPGIQGTFAAKPKAWQEQSWAFTDAIGEVKQASYFLSNTMSLVRLFIAERSIDGQPPAPPAEGTPGLFEARDALDRLAGTTGGHGWLLQRGTLNLNAAGEYFLVGYPEVPARLPDPSKLNDEGDPGQPERWEVHSVSELTSKGQGKAVIYEVKPSRDAKTAKPVPDDALVVRVWQQHPQFGGEADCALAACLAECDELLILSRTIRAAARSRLAGAGMLFLPSELSFGSDDEGDTGEGVEGEGDDLDTKLMEAMTAPIADEGHASAVVPIIVRGPSEHGQHIKHHTFDRPLDPVAAEQRKELLGRLMAAVDVPMEQVMGMSSANHWTAYQVDQSTWTRYGQPKATIQVEAWTAGYLRPTLLEAGLSADVADRYVIWFDPAGAIADLDRSDVAFKAHDRILISDETARTELGYSDADAPDDAEVERRIAQGLPGVAPSNAGGPPSGEAPSGPAARVLRLFRRPGVVASSRPPLGTRLAAVDRLCRSRLEEAAHAALRRSLERAGARVRTKASRRPDMRNVVSTITAAEVMATLGRDRVGELATEDELLEGGMPELRDRFDKNVSAAQARALALLAEELDLSDDEVQQISRQQDQDRQAAWVWLAGAMAGLAKQRLYDPRPSAPAKGEFDASALVQPGLIREAMARAGGDPGPTTANATPPGGIGTGTLVQDLWARHGGIVNGWVWLYGDAGSRSNPFPGHEDLDGVEFASWSDDALRVQPGDEWLGADRYSPGDHPWCQCDFAPLMADRSVDQAADDGA